MEKKLLVILVLLCIAIGNANAAGFNVNVIPNNAEILVGTNQYASYDLQITNNYGFEDRFEIEVRDYSWSIWSDPWVDYVGGGPDIKPGETYTVHLFAKPLEQKLVGRHTLPLFVKSLGGKEEFTKQIYIDVVSVKPTLNDFALALVVSVSIPEYIDPREEAVMDVSVENLYPGNISGINLNIESELIKTQTKFNMKPLGKTSLSFPLKFSPYQTPLIDTITLTFSHDGKEIKSLKTHYTIEPYSDVRKTQDELKNGFLKSERTITFYNNGNKDETKKFYTKTNFIQKLFTSTKPAYFQMKNQTGSYLGWELKLQPMVSAQISIAQNYSFIFWIVLLAVIMWLVYMFLRTPLMLDKGAKVIEVKEGAISQIKVLLTLKNRTSKQIINIRLADRVPDIGAISQEFDMGTLRPEKVVRDERGGTVLKWIIPSIEPYEERLITYKIKARLQVVGTFALPSALAKFKTNSGSELKTKSGRGRIVG